MTKRTRLIKDGRQGPSIVTRRPREPQASAPILEVLGIAVNEVIVGGVIAGQVRCDRETIRMEVAQ